MNHKHSKLLQLAGFIFLATLLAGCGKPLEQAIIGTWIDEDHPGEYAKFLPDHTFVMGNSATSFKGKWEKVSDDQLRLDLGVKFIRFEKIRITGNRMKFWSDGVETSCIRRK